LVLYFVLLFSPDLSSYQLKKRLFLTLTLKKTNYVSGNQKVVETPLATEFSIDDDECCLDPCLAKEMQKIVMFCYSRFRSWNFSFCRLSDCRTTETDTFHRLKELAFGFLSTERREDRQKATEIATEGRQN
jgi:hypothetical protein